MYLPHSLCPYDCVSCIVIIQLVVSMATPGYPLFEMAVSLSLVVMELNRCFGGGNQSGLDLTICLFCSFC